MDPICFLEKVAKRHFINFLNSSHDLELQAELFYGWAAWGWALHFLQEINVGRCSKRNRLGIDVCGDGCQELGWCTQRRMQVAQVVVERKDEEHDADNNNNNLKNNAILNLGKSSILVSLTLVSFPLIFYIDRPNTHLETYDQVLPPKLKLKRRKGKMKGSFQSKMLPFHPVVLVALGRWKGAKLCHQRCQERKLQETRWYAIRVFDRGNTHLRFIRFEVFWEKCRTGWVLCPHCLLWSLGCIHSNSLVSKMFCFCISCLLNWRDMIQFESYILQAWKHYFP